MLGPGFTLNDFRAVYEPRPPRWPPDPVEAIPIGATSLLPPAPAVNVSLGRPKESQEDPGINTYLWVIDEAGIPYVLEAEWVELNGRPPKHTNLTSGGEAYVGGEMWFETNRALWVSGGSGRYHPASEQQLGDSVRVFEDFGYSVRSLGWDPEQGRARRHLEKA